MDSKRLKILASRHCGTLIGEPQPVDLSRHCPLFAFVCPVALPEGCSPPQGRIPMRIGAGAALSSQWARTLSLFEAVERYSLQYQADDPETAKATGLCSSVQEEMPTSRLMLGHPATSGTDGVVDSRGCSIGRNLADAAIRGLLELIERDAIEAWRGGETRLARTVAVPHSSWLDPMTNWLDGLGRALNILQFTHPSGASTFLCVCCDADGTKPALGSAAGFDPAQTLIRACVEAVVSWRNLMAIDMNGLMDADLSPAHAGILRLYRGQSPMPDGKIEASGVFPGPLEARPADLSQNDLRQQLDTLLLSIDQPVSIFDMTRKTIEIPVVRVVKQPT